MKLYGLIGFPLSHSFSRKFFTKKFKEEKKAESYENFEIDDIKKLPEIIEVHPELVGLNVTIPYKEKVIPYLNEIDAEAKAIAAVNTIRINRSGDKIQLKGFNTDTYGFKQSLLPLLAQHHKRALILGTGGASKAIKHVLTELGITFQVVSRTSSAATLGYKDLTPDIINKHQIIINCTPLGTFPATDECPDIPYTFLGQEHLLYDLVYNPETTLFMKKGAEQGAKVCNGYEMLVLQALRSYEIWNAI